jgi:hypothetical protein
MDTQLLNVIHTGLVNGRLIPYLGPGVLSLSEAPAPIPATPAALVGKLTAKATVPHKIRNTSPPPRSSSRTSSIAGPSASP